MILRKLTYISLILVAGVVTACSNDDEGDRFQNINSIQVTKADLSVGADGGTREIVFHSAGKVSAVSKADWCTITSENDTSVTVQIQQNTSMESRNTQIVLSDGTNSYEAAVMQEGFIFVADAKDINHTLSYSGGTISVNFKSNLPCTVTIPDEAKSWLTYKIEDGQLMFTAAEDTEKKPRGVDVTVQTGEKKQKYNISQIEMSEADLTGVWTWSFSNNYGPQSVKRSLTKSGNDYLVTYNPSLGIAFPLRWSDEDQALVFKAGRDAGTFQNYQLLTVIYNGKLNSTGEFKAKPIYRNGSIRFEFYNSNQAGNISDVEMLMIGGFTPNEDGSSYSYEGALVTCYYFTLSKAVD